VGHIELGDFINDDANGYQDSIRAVVDEMKSGRQEYIQRRRYARIGAAGQTGTSLSTIRGYPRNARRDTPYPSCKKVRKGKVFAAVSDERKEASKPFPFPS